MAREHKLILAVITPSFWPRVWNYVYPHYKYSNGSEVSPFLGSGKDQLQNLVNRSILESTLFMYHTSFPRLHQSWGKNEIFRSLSLAPNPTSFGDQDHHPLPFKVIPASVSCAHWDAIFSFLQPLFWTVPWLKSYLQEPHGFHCSWCPLLMALLPMPRSCRSPPLKLLAPWKSQMSLR